MKISRTKARSRLAAKMSKDSHSIRFMRQMTDGLMAFRQGEKAILTTNDDALSTVIGEFDANHLDISTRIPPAMSAWIDEIGKEISDYQSKNNSMIVKIKAVASGGETPISRVTIKPLIKTTWNQGAPYNQGLKFDGKSVIVGCNAVAIGQIMFYWARKGYKRGCTATKAYTSKTAKYKVPSLASVIVFDFDNMTYGKPSTEKQETAVSNMLKHIGYALQSDYTPTLTTASVSNVVNVFNKSLRMGSAMRILARYGYDKWEQQIYDEIVKEHPVAVLGCTSSGGCHIFIVDGYNADTDMYHVNWGWGGSCDGYFKLSVLDATSSKAYSFNKQAIVGIVPEYVLGDANKDGKVTITDAISIAEEAARGGNDLSMDLNNDGKITIEDANIVADNVLGKQNL